MNCIDPASKSTSVRNKCDLYVCYYNIVTFKKNASLFFSCNLPQPDLSVTSGWINISNNICIMYIIAIYLYYINLSGLRSRPELSSESVPRSGSICGSESGLMAMSRSGLISGLLSISGSGFGFIAASIYANDQYHICINVWINTWIWIWTELHLLVPRTTHMNH